jgi:hypothetical protein
MVVGLVSLVMARKNLGSRGFLPFHEQVLGRPWDDVDHGPQLLVGSLMKLAGLGFGVVGLQLLAVPLIGVLADLPLLGFVAALEGLLYCVGLFAVNYRLFSATGAHTPWRGSLYASVALVLAAGVFAVLLWL